MTAFITSIAMPKGGSGKSTTTATLGAALAAFQDRRVLLVDTDAQGHLGMLLGVSSDKGLGEVILGENEAADVLVEARDNLDLLPSGGQLPKAIKQVSSADGSADLLYNAVHTLEPDYDHILVDTSSSWSVMPLSCLFYADQVLIPVPLETLAIKSLARFVTRLNQVRKHTDLSIFGILPTAYDRRVGQSDIILQSLRESMSSHVFDPIRYSVRVSEMSVSGETIFEYDPSSRAVDEYKAIASALDQKRSKASKNLMPIARNAGRDNTPTPPKPSVVYERQDGTEMVRLQATIPMESFLQIRQNAALYPSVAAYLIDALDLYVAGRGQA